MSNPWALEVHDFDQVHLVPGRRESRVLPNLGLTVEEVATGAVPAHSSLGRPSVPLREGADLVVTGQNPTLLVKDPRDQWRLQNRVRWG